MMNSLVSSLTAFTDNISDNLNNITSLISNTLFKDHNDLQKEDGKENENQTTDWSTNQNDHQVEAKTINSGETMRKGYSEDVPDANPDYQPAYDTQEQPWPWSMNQR